MSPEEGPKCHVSKSSSKSLSHDEATSKDTALGCVSLGKLLAHPLPAFLASRGVLSLVLVPSWLPGEWRRWCVCATGRHCWGGSASEFTLSPYWVSRKLLYSNSSSYYWKTVGAVGKSPPMAGALALEDAVGATRDGQENQG